MATDLGHNSASQTHSRLPQCASRLVISAKPAHHNRASPHPKVVKLIFRLWGTPVVDMFATVHNTYLPQFISPVPEPQALVIAALTQDWQVRSMYMFPPFPLLNKVIQKFKTTLTGKVIPIAPWWPSQPWFPPLLRLCVDHPRFFPFRRYLLSQQGYISSGESYHLHAWRLSCSTTKQQDFQKRSLSSLQLLGDPLQMECTMTGFANWTTGKGFDPIGPKAARIADFLYELFGTRGLSLQTIKGYRSCLASSLATQARRQKSSLRLFQT